MSLSARDKRATGHHFQMCRVTVFLIISLTCKDGPQSKSCAIDCLRSVVSMAGPQTASKFELSLPFNWVVKCCFPPTLATSLASGYQLPAGQVSRHLSAPTPSFLTPSDSDKLPFSFEQIWVSQCLASFSRMQDT